MRILVTRLKFLGDIVLSTPVLDTLRERFPDAKIEYLALAPHGEVLRDHPSLDRLHLLPSRPGASDFVRVVRALRDGPRIDWAFDLFTNPRSSLLVALSGARQRVGSARGLRSRIFQHRRGRPDGDRSAIRHHLDKLVPLLGSEPPVRPTSLGVDAGAATATLERLGLEAGEYTLVHPGSTWPEKAWPVERWPQLMASMERERFGRLLVVCPPGEEPVAQRVATEGGGDLLPQLTIPELSALLSRSRAYVGNDGGVLHMAVAHRIPTVGLFGPTEPDIWFPYEAFGPYRVIQRCDESAPAGASQLGGISVDEVRRALDDVMAGSRGEVA